MIPAKWRKKKEKKPISFAKALSYQNKDVIIKSEVLRKLCKAMIENKPSIIYERDFIKMQNVADEVPMPMAKANLNIITIVDELTYNDITDEMLIFSVEEDEY